jgi:hypothetical protein
MGSAGTRKMRWSRVVYYWISKDEQILFLTVYRKTEAADLSQEAIREMRKLVKSLD